MAKFYRPGRWSDAQIEEEHRFAAELMAAEIPAVAPLVLNGQTLHHFGGFSFAVSPRRGGRRPELDDFEVLEWIGRFLARIHSVGAAAPFVQRPALDVASFGHEPRDWLMGHRMVAPEVQTAWSAARAEALALIESHPVLRDRVRRPTKTASGASACTATATPATSCGHPKASPVPDRTLWIWTTREPARRCRTSGCCSAATGASRTSSSAL